MNDNDGLITLAPRHIRCYPITPETFPHLFISGNKITVLKGFPEDAQFRGYTIDPERNVMNVFMEHPSFEVCHPGCEPYRAYIEIHVEKPKQEENK